MLDLFESAQVRFKPDEEQIARAEASLGIAFPPSYRAFCLECGAGLIGERLMIYVPRDDVDDERSITFRSRLVRERFDKIRAELRDEGTEDLELWEGVGDLSVVDRAVYIGHGIDGEALFWDVRGEGEFDVYVDCRFEIRFGGKTLDEFIRRCLTQEVKAILGPGHEPLPSLFEGAP